MIIRKVAIELTEKQYEKLCQMAASAGKTVEKVVQTFVEELPENEVLQDWLGKNRKETSFHICQKKESLN